jgi:cytochrome c oxidase subunit II
MTRRTLRAALAGLVLAAGSAVIVAAAESHGDEQHVAMVAMKFDYLPDQITVKKGKPVVLELSTLDRIHGFNVPGLGLRTDIPPGPSTFLRFTPDKAGTFNLHCDNFCGDGHEGMTGQIIVTD